MTSLNETHWVFDLDGTLTVGIHDFVELRRRMGIAEHAPILESISKAEPAEAQRLNSIVEDWEWELADLAEPAEGASALLDALARVGCQVGILTRNIKPIALKTLKVTGLDGYFNVDDVLGRHDAPPKPEPGGVLRLLEQWNAEPQDSVMLGDYVFDVQAGRRAGSRTVLVGTAPEAWSEWIDIHTQSLNDIRPARQ